MTERARPGAGVVLLRGDGAALLQHRDERPGLRLRAMWVPPGGHCAEGETSTACARRELQEETGYVAEEADLEWLATFVDWHSDPADPQVLTIFWAPYDGVQDVQCFEGQAVEFVERARAEALRVPTYLVVLWDAAIAASRALSLSKR